MFEFDEIIEELGSFGPYQIRVFILVSLFETPAAWAMFLPVFSHAVPSWICLYTNGSLQDSNTLALVNNTENATQHDSSSNVSLSEAGCSKDGGFCESVQFTSGFTSIRGDFNLCGESHIPTLITTLQMVGVLIGACVTGQLADTFGRKNVFYTVYVLMLVSGVATCFAHIWQIYAVCRMFVGMFFGGTMVINFVLPLEFVGRKWRTFCGCIGFWAVGVMTLAPLAYFIQNWRYLSMTCSLLGIPLIFTWWFIDESPRWLVQKGRISESEVILKRIAKCNKKSNPDFSKLRACARSAQNTRKENTKYSYWDLFRTCSMLKNTLIIMFTWFVSSSVYYGTTLNVGNLSGNKYLNLFLSGLVEIPALIVVVLVNNKIGRRKTLSSLMMIAGLSCFVILIVDLSGKTESLSYLVITFAMLGKSGISGGWAAAQVFSAETFPTVVRNIGIGASSMSARVGGIVAPQLVILSTVSQPLPFTVFGCLAVTCSILSYLLPETLNSPLPDTLPERTLCRGCSTKKTDTVSIEIDQKAHGQIDLSNNCTGVLLTKLESDGKEVAVGS